MAIGPACHRFRIIARIALDGRANATIKIGIAAGPGGRRSVLGLFSVLLQTRCEPQKQGCFNAVFGFDRYIITLRMSDDG